MIIALLIAGVPLDPVGDPLPQYLSLSSVRSVLDGTRFRLNECGVDKDLTVNVALQVKGNGEITVDELTGVEGTQAECWAATLSEATSLRHDDAPQRVTATFYVRSQEVLFSPELMLHEREPSPLLIFSPGSERDRIYSVIHDAEPIDQ